VAVSGSAAELVSFMNPHHRGAPVPEKIGTFEKLAYEAEYKDAIKRGAEPIMK